MSKKKFELKLSDFDDCFLDDEEDSKEASDNEPEKNDCPKKHGLKKISTDANDYVCDICKKRLNIFLAMYSCRKCDYDICKNCYEKKGDQKSINNERSSMFNQAPSISHSMVRRKIKQSGGGISIPKEDDQVKQSRKHTKQINGFGSNISSASNGSVVDVTNGYQIPHQEKIGNQSYHNVMDIYHATANYSSPEVINDKGPPRNQNRQQPPMQRQVLNDGMNQRQNPRRPNDNQRRQEPREHVRRQHENDPSTMNLIIIVVIVSIFCAVYFNIQKMWKERGNPAKMTIEQQLAMYKKQVNQYDIKSKQLETQVTKLELENENLKTKIQEQINLYEQSKKSLIEQNKLALENKIVQSELMKDKEFWNYKKERETIERELNLQILSLNSTLQNCQIDLKTMEEANQERRVQIHDLKNSMKTIISDLEKKHNEEVAKLKEDHKKKNNDLKEKLSVKEKEYSDMNNCCTKKTSQLNNCQITHSSCKKDSLKLKEKVESGTEDLEICNLNSFNLKQRGDKVINDLGKCQDIRDLYKENLDEVKITCKEEKQKLIDMYNQANVANDKKNNLILEKMEKKLKEQQETLHEKLEKQNEKIHEKVKKQKEEMDTKVKKQKEEMDKRVQEQENEIQKHKNELQKQIEREEEFRNKNKELLINFQDDFPPYLDLEKSNKMVICSKTTYDSTDLVLRTWTAPKGVRLNSTYSACVEAKIKKTGTYEIVLHVSYKEMEANRIAIVEVVRHTPVGIDWGTAVARVCHLVDDEGSHFAELDENSSVPSARQYVCKVPQDGSYKRPSNFDSDEDDEIFDNVDGMMSNFIFGEEAYQFFDKQPNRCIRNPKRILGARPTDTAAVDFVEQLESDVQIHEDEVIWYIDGEEYRMEEIVGMQLKWFVITLSNILEYDVNKIILSIPAVYNKIQRQALSDAAQFAEVEIIRMINEPTAVALAHKYLLSTPIYDLDEMMIIFDPGDGTTDVTLMILLQKTINVIDVGGDPFFGGQEFTTYTMELIKKKIMDDNKLSSKLINISEHEQRLFNAALRKSAEETKEMLSSRTEHFCVISWASKRISLMISRKEYHLATNHLIEKMVKYAEDILETKERKYTHDSVKTVVCAGGPSKDPRVEEALNRMFPSANIFCGGGQIHPRLMTAMGSKLAQKHEHVNIDVLSQNVAILLVDENSEMYCQPILYRGWPYESTDTITLSTMDRFATFRMFQGPDTKNCAKNLFLGEFEITGLSPGDDVEVTVLMDLFGNIHINATIAGGKTHLQELSVDVKQGRFCPRTINKARKRIAENLGLVMDQHFTILTEQPNCSEEVPKLDFSSLEPLKEIHLLLIDDSDSMHINQNRVRTGIQTGVQLVNQILPKMLSRFKGNKVEIYKFGSAVDLLLEFGQELDETVLQKILQKCQGYGGMTRMWQTGWEQGQALIEKAKKIYSNFRLVITIITDGDDNRSQPEDWQSIDGMVPMLKSFENLHLNNPPEINVITFNFYDDEVKTFGSLCTRTKGVFVNINFRDPAWREVIDHFNERYLPQGHLRQKIREEQSSAYELEFKQYQNFGN